MVASFFFYPYGTNRNIQMFIGTSDYKTVEEFSKRCGNFSVITRNVGYNTVKADDINSNASIKERPLIYPSELSQLNRPGDMGHAIVTVFGYQPIRSDFTPSYAATAYTLEKTVQRLGVGRYFDEEKIFYDMEKRNELAFHNLCYKLHIEPEKTRSADLDYCGDTRFAVWFPSKILAVLGF